MVVVMCDRGHAKEGVCMAESAISKQAVCILLECYYCK